MSDPINTTTIPQALAVDYSACIRDQYQIGHTVLHNICNGEVSNVPWGALDWLAFVGLGGMVAILFLFFLGLTLSFVRSPY